MVFIFFGPGHRAAAKKMSRSALCLSLECLVPDGLDIQFFPARFSVCFRPYAFVVDTVTIYRLARNLLECCSTYCLMQVLIIWFFADLSIARFPRSAHYVQAGT